MINFYTKLKFLYSVFVFIGIFQQSYSQKISASSLSASVILKDSSLWMWGYNESGQLGDGTTINGIKPKNVSRGTHWLTVSAGAQHSLAIRQNRTLWAWGDNSRGQLGIGKSNSSLLPTQVGNDSNWVYVAAGRFHSLGIKADGTLWAWGCSSGGVLGNGTRGTVTIGDTLNKFTPVQIGSDHDWKRAFAAMSTSFAIKSNGTLWGWGYSLTGLLGNGNNGIDTFQTTPIQVGIDNDWKEFSAGYYHNLAIKTNGTLYAWGINNFGRLGDGTLIDRNQPTQIGSDTNWSLISAGFGHSLALKTDATIWSWGTQLALGDSTVSTDIYSPLQIGSDHDWSFISAGNGFSICQKNDGNYWGWGINQYGQVGNNAISNKTYPFHIGYEKKWVDISCSKTSSFAIDKNGELWGSGLNTSNHIGINQRFFHKIGNDNNWNSVYSASYLLTNVSYNHTFGIKKDHTLWGWGYNAYGTLGDGTKIDKNTPTQIGIENNWDKISTSISHTLAIKLDSTLWAWGGNGYGQLGDGTLISRITPTQIGKSKDWKQVCAVSPGVSYAIKYDGSLWSWGFNFTGGLGNGTRTDLNSPTRIGSDNDWSLISSTYYSGSISYAIKNDGSIWTWGMRMQSSQDTAKILVPVKQGNISTWKIISCGFKNRTAIKEDSSMWSWGVQYLGNIGDSLKSTFTVIDSAINIGSFTKWMKVDASKDGDHSMAIGKDSSLWVWGDNSSGQLGDGDGFAFYRSPIYFTCDQPSKPIASSISRCGPGSLILTATHPQGSTVDWYLVPTGGTALAKGYATVTTPVITKTTNVYLESRNTSTGCVSTSRTMVTVTINAIPSAPIAVGTSRCGPGTVILNATPPSGSTVDWYLVPTGGTALAKGYTTVKTPYISTTTNGYLQSRNTTTGCVSSTRTKVTVTINNCITGRVNNVTDVITDLFVDRNMQVKVFPNPSVGVFNLNVSSSSNELIHVRVLDAQGRVITTSATTPSKNTLLGDKLRPGVYYVEVTQGKYNEFVKLVKQ